MSGLLATTAVLLAVAAPTGQRLSERFEEGAKHYWAGRFPQAYETWRALADYDIEDPDLYYDLGNAAFQLGRAGEALAWYERARRLDPGDDDLLANLAAAAAALQADKVVRVVKKGTPAGEGSFEWWYRLFTRLSPLLLVWLTGLCNVLFFGLLVARRFHERSLRRALLGWAGLVVLLLGLAAGTLLAGRAYVDARVHVGVTTGRPTAVRDGPTPEARVLFELPEGQLVRLLDTQDGFSHALVNPALQGWVADADVLDVR